MKDSDEIKFVARHYRKGRFAVDPALRRIVPGQTSWWTKARIAAASIAVVVISATAAVVIHNMQSTDSPATIKQETKPAMQYDKFAVRVIDFEDTPLPVVVDKINEIYGVDVVGLPDNADEYHLSLHYEGTADDLVETINEILGTDIAIIE